MTDPGSGTLERLLRGLPLRALGTDPLELAEAVWLAEQMQRGRGTADGAADPARTGPEDPGGDDDADAAAGGSPGAAGSTGRIGRRGRGAQDRTPLFLPGLASQDPDEPGDAGTGSAGPDGDRSAGAGGTGGFRVRVPAREALPRQSEYLGALRDFKRLVPAGPATVFDEAATVEATARSGAIVVRTRPRERPMLSAVCVVDCGRSMPLWHDAALDFARLVRLSGVFRDVEVVRLGEDGSLSGPARAEPPSATADGAHATFVLTDGISTGWQEPVFRRRLAAWARGGPTAVVNPLPERLWSRTTLRPLPGAVLAADPGAPNSTMRFRPFGGVARTVVDLMRPAGPGKGPRLIPVPMLELEPGRIARWAAFVRAPSAAGFACGLVFPAPAPDGFGPPSGRAGAPDPGRLFQATASPAAVRLAAHLATLRGWLNLPIMRYVQDIAVPESGPTHLAEVLLGGVLEQRTAGEGPAAVRQYRVLAHARDQLLRQLPPDAEEFLADRIAQRLGRGDGGAGWFVAMAGTSGAQTGPDGEAPFALARTDLVGRLPQISAAPEPELSAAEVCRRRADRAHEMFRASGRMEDLEQAVGHRMAALAAAEPAERAERAVHLIAQLVYRWLFSRDRDDLDRAFGTAAAERSQSAPEAGTVPEFDLAEYTMVGWRRTAPFPDFELATSATEAAYLSMESVSLRGSDQRGQHLDQLDHLAFEAVEQARRAVETQRCPAEHGLARYALAIALSGNPTDPDPTPADAAEAIAAFQEATTMVTDQSAPLPVWGQTAARRALALARAEGGPEALDWAVGQLRGTAVRGAVVDAERAPLLADLATALRLRFGRDNSPGDLAEAILHLRTVLGQDGAGERLLPPAERARCLRELGWAFEQRFELNGRRPDLGEAADCYRQACELAGPGLPELTASCLVAWGRVLMRLQRHPEARERLSQGVAAYTDLGLAGHDTALLGKRLLQELDSTGR